MYYFHEETYDAPFSGHVSGFVAFEIPRFHFHYVTVVLVIVKLLLISKCDPVNLSNKKSEESTSIDLFNTLLI